MSVHVIRMPDLGEGIAEVELVAWRVKPGDAVAEDQLLADVMTDKATVEIPSPVAGTVLALGGEVGTMMAVGSELIRIELDAGAGAAVDAAAGASAKPAAAPARAAREDTAAAAAPNAVKVSAVESSPPVPARPRPIASPAVRARAWELGIDLADIVAGGAAGRVMHADLDAHLARGGRRVLHAAAPAPAAALPRAAMPAALPAPLPDPLPAPLPASLPVPAARATTPPGAVEQIKIVGLRRKIAQKMQESKRRIPHFTYVEELDVSDLEALRETLNTKWAGQRLHLTLLPYIVRAIVLAVREFPQVNARFDDEAGMLTRYAAVHMGIATQTDAGLMVPVLRNAEQHDLWANAGEIARLAGAARSGKVVRDELSGSTLTVTSLGRQGGIVTTPVINHPEVAIVGVNRIVARPVIRGGAVMARQMMNLSSSFDHRVVDGAVAAAFVQRLRELLEQPALLFVE